MGRPTMTDQDERKTMPPPIGQTEIMNVASTGNVAGWVGGVRSV